MAEVAVNLKTVYDKILRAAANRTLEHRYYEPRLVAVSKLQSVESILSAYQAGQRYFGENYVTELLEKSSHPGIFDKCEEIRWHFIGHLQRNKVNKILSVPNLYVIETVDTVQIADALNNSWGKKNCSTELRIMVQVNTSREKEKQGCDMAQVSTLVKHIIDNCTNLKFVGLMTIGMFGYDFVKNGPNPDFTRLIECRKMIHDQLAIDSKDIELSMGMSNDYEHAIELGSTSVRVGTAIFGNRPQKRERTLSKERNC